ncbi:MAG: cation:proton antiporter [Candidatus Contendobacter sp.]|nr:cation:proton antiporter [Candidatus Contendobacter sp.]
MDRREWLPDYLHRVASLALVLGVFTLSNALAAESGLLAVTAMGLRLANSRDLVIQDILDFKETLTLLLISVLFIVLAARIERAFAGMGWDAVGVLFAVLCVARPAAVWLATVGSDLDWRRKAVLAWIAPRGIVAAAVSAIFALHYAIRATTLTANFDFAAFRAKWDDRAIPLFALDPKGILRVFSTRELPQPSPGWTLISLMPPADTGDSHR